ncbi:DUF4147 domain-containing protein [Ectothiorhodospiraceae bacterium 2226]|nr:DUF4147 domain-containing protein [Ectothiorhodospiraceae bacterium 2226]
MLHAALESVRGERVVADYLAAHRPPRPSALLSVGKAACSMAAGALAHWPGLDGLVVTKPGHLAPGCRALECIEAGHPEPDAESLRAGRRVREWIAGTPHDASLMFLLSGGASALLEALPAGVELEALVRLNRWLLASGLPIDQVNALRQRVSLVKAGRLARVLAGRRVLQLVISDVPDDRLDIIGSAPLYPVAWPPLPAHLPHWVAALLDRAPPPLAADEPAAAWVSSHILASNGHARRAAVAAAVERGLAVHEHAAPLAGEAAGLGEQLARSLLEGPDGLHVWGGETTVTLPPHPGRGGRNQHLALAAARELAGQGGVWLLAVGTDGSDGPTEEAGALIDGGSVARGEAAGEDAARALRHADAGTFLEAAGDLVDTGPTGTNVMDLVLGLRIR